MMRTRKQLPSAPTVVDVAKDMQAAVWAEVSTRLLRGLRALLEGLLEPEVTSQVGAGRYERTTTRRGHRNGHYSRNLLTTHGPLPRLRVPRLLHPHSKVPCAADEPMRSSLTILELP